MPAEVLVRRCTLRLVRRGGWSWGAAPERLLSAAVAQLPRLVAERLALRWPEDLECEIVAPLRLALTLSSRELAALAASTGGTAESAARLDKPLAARIDAAIASALSQAPLPAAIGERGPGESVAAAGQPAVESAREPAVLAALLEWHRSRRLAALLPAFSMSALEAWHTALMAVASVPPVSRDAPPDEPLALLAQRIAAEPLPLAAGRTARIVRRMLLLVAAAHGHGVAPAGELAAELLRSHPAFALDLPPALSPVQGSTESATARELEADAIRLPRDEVEGEVVRTATAVRAASLPARIESFEVRVECALPFLLLGPLARCGYLATVAATLEAVGIADESARFATAFARKALDTPVRGWHRSPASVAAAAAFAARREPVPDPQIANFARRLAPCASALDAFVAQSLAAGHAPGKALVLQAGRCGADSGFVLCHEDGLLAVAWAPRVERLFTTLAAFERAPLVVPRTAVTNEVLAALDAAEFHFVTDAPPARGEPWRPVHGARPRAWSNRPDVEAGNLLRLAGRVDEFASETQATWRGLHLDRPALPPGGEREVERAFTIGAALGLGALAWELWSAREPATPMLALARFHDLGAVVRLTREGVEVRLPRGRRFDDLQAHGLLADVHGVPWFGGRPLRFGRG